MGKTDAGVERIELVTLTDGGQSADQVAAEVVEFIDGARRTLKLALYDIRLPGPIGDRVRDALVAAADRGVAVHLAYNLAHSHDAEDSAPPRTEPSLIESLPLPTRGIPGEPDLMHHKYVVRDGEVVWTGSMNWTLDSWERQENVILRVHDGGVAAAYAADFDDLWRRGDVDGSGAAAVRTHRVGTAPVRAWFCPGRGPELSTRIAAAIAAAQRRVRIASPLLTAAPIITTIDAYEGDLTGVVDATQVGQVLHQWRENPAARWKGPVLARLLERHRFSGKRSTPWASGAVHDFLHAKVVVADDVVFAGSFNHSRSGEQNAENVLEIEDAALADRLAGWIDELRERYATDQASTPWARPAATSASTASSGSSQSLTSSRSSGDT
jgi:phosphatidylserine/phosphatidylglycerophosphate/cardiolipin synthase-like enzyme